MAKGEKQQKEGEQRDDAEKSVAQNTVPTPQPGVASSTAGVEEIDFSSPTMLGAVPTTTADTIEFEVAPLSDAEFAWRHRASSEMLPNGEKIVFLGGDLDKLAARRDWSRVMDEEDIPIEIAAQLSYYGLSAEEASMYWRADPDDLYRYMENIDELAVFPEDFSRAAQMLNSALVSGEVIGIHYDYDTDGICSAITLEEHLRSVWPHPDTDIDARLAFTCADAQRGFGFFNDDVDELVAQGATLAFVLDSGPPEPGVVAYAQEKGLQLVYIDHHELNEGNLAMRANVPIVKLRDDNVATAGTAAQFSAYHRRHPLGGGADVLATEADLIQRGAARQFLQDQLDAHYDFYRLSDGVYAGSMVALPKEADLDGYYLTLENDAVAMPAATAENFLQTQQDGVYLPCHINRVPEELLVELSLCSGVRSDFYKEPPEIQAAAIKEFQRLTPTQAQAAIVGNLGDAGSMMSLHNRLLYAEARTSMLKPEEEQTPFMGAVREIANTRNGNKGFGGENGLLTPSDVTYWVSPTVSIAKRTPVVSAADVKKALYDWTPQTANAEQLVDTYMDLKNTADNYTAQFRDPNNPAKMLPQDSLGLIFVPGLNERRYMGMGGRLAAELTKDTPNPIGVYIEDPDTGNVRVNFRSGKTKLNVAELIEYCKTQLPDIPISGGGHAAAGGLSVPKEHWKDVYPVLQAGTAAQADANPYFYPSGGPGEPTEPKPIFVTAPSTLSRIGSAPMREAYRRLEPYDSGYGKGNREPLYLVDGGEMTLTGSRGRSRKGKAVKGDVEVEFLTTEAAESFPHTGKAVFAWDNRYSIFRVRRLLGQATPSERHSP